MYLRDVINGEGGGEIYKKERVERVCLNLYLFKKS